MSLSPAGAVGRKVCQLPIKSEKLSMLDQEMNLSERAASRQARLETSIPVDLPPWHLLSPEVRATAPDPELHRTAPVVEWRHLVKRWLEGIRARQNCWMDAKKWLDGDYGGKPQWPPRKQPLQPGVYCAGTAELQSLTMDFVGAASGDGSTVTLKMLEEVHGIHGGLSSANV